MKGMTAPPMKKKGFLKSFFGLDDKGAEVEPMGASKMGPMGGKMASMGGMSPKKSPGKPSKKGFMKGPKRRWMV